MSVDANGSAVVFEKMVGVSPAMRAVFARIDRIADSPAPILIVGESGTGKDLVARALHSRSRRSAGPFISVHTGAVPKELVANELFGHLRGAFTGAFASTEGKFAAAHGGTLFLDEVGTMDPAMQICLLRVLETYRYTRVGGTKEETADVRIIAATNSDLLDLVDKGLFREDLFYRLNVFTMVVPPLRERRDDILPIAHRFLRLAAERYGLAAKTLSPEASETLLAHSWPGNVRELRNAMDQAAIFASAECVTSRELDLVRARIPIFRASELGRPPPVDMAIRRALNGHSRLASPAAPETATDDDEKGSQPMVVRVSIGTSLAATERLLILKTLDAVSGNKRRAAHLLGISRRGLYLRLASFEAPLSGADPLASS